MQVGSRLNTHLARRLQCLVYLLNLLMLTYEGGSVHDMQPLLSLIVVQADNNKQMKDGEMLLMLSMNYMGVLQKIFWW